MDTREIKIAYTLHGRKIGGNEPQEIKKVLNVITQPFLEITQSL